MTLVLLAAACAKGPVCVSPASAGEVAAPPAPACDNAQLERYTGLLVLAPHPDDEVLAFAGLVDAYLQQGKPVEVVVVTDGDAYCEACRFWKSGSTGGPLCTAEELSNLATAAVDSFAEVRREESRRALARLGAGPPRFLGYPDIGIRIVSPDLRGALMDGCRVRLEAQTASSRATTATLSQDGRSLYAWWDEPPGFLAVHR